MENDIKKTDDGMVEVELELTPEELEELEKRAKEHNMTVDEYCVACCKVPAQIKAAKNLTNKLDEALQMENLSDEARKSLTNAKDVTLALEKYLSGDMSEEEFKNIINPL